jgi:hypothetical protein
MPLIYNDPEHWRARADEARALAEQMTDPGGKAATIEIEGKYGQRARRALKRITGERAHPNKFHQKPATCQRTNRTNRA